MQNLKLAAIRIFGLKIQVKPVTLKLKPYVAYVRIVQVGEFTGARST